MKDQYNNEIGDTYEQMEALGKMMEEKVKGFENMLNNVDKHIKPEDRPKFGKAFGSQINEMYEVVGKSREAAEKVAKKFHERSN